MTFLQEKHQFFRGRRKNSTYGKSWKNNADSELSTWHYSDTRLERWFSDAWNVSVTMRHDRGAWQSDRNGWNLARRRRKFWSVYGLRMKNGLFSDDLSENLFSKWRLLLCCFCYLKKIDFYWKKSKKNVFFVPEIAEIEIAEIGPLPPNIAEIARRSRLF